MMLLHRCSFCLLACLVTAKRTSLWSRWHLCQTEAILSSFPLFWPLPSLGTHFSGGLKTVGSLTIFLRDITLIWFPGEPRKGVSR
jgi:hypothetical protein